MSVSSAETETWETETSYDAFAAAFAFEDPSISCHDGSTVYGHSDTNTDPLVSGTVYGHFDTNTEPLVSSPLVDDCYPYMPWDPTISQQENASRTRIRSISAIEGWQVKNYADAEDHNQPYSQPNEPSIDPTLLLLQFLQPSMYPAVCQPEQMSPRASGVYDQGLEVNVHEADDGIHPPER